MHSPNNYDPLICRQRPTLFICRQRPALARHPPARRAMLPASPHTVWRTHACRLATLESGVLAVVAKGRLTLESGVLAVGAKGRLAPLVDVTDLCAAPAAIPSDSDAHQRVRGLLEHLKEHDRHGGSNLAALALAQISTWWWTNNTHAYQHKLIHLCNEYALEVGGKASDHLAPKGRQDGGHIALALALRAPSRCWLLLRSAVANGRPDCCFSFASGRRLCEAQRLAK